MNIIIIFILLLVLIIYLPLENYSDLFFDINLVKYNVISTKDKTNLFYEEINNLHKLNFNKEIYNINDNDYIVYAMYNDKIIGFCFLKLLSNNYESVVAIYSLNVLDQYRKNGIASNLLSYAKKYIESINQNIIVLGVDNYNLIDFYQNNDFNIYNNNNGYYIFPHENNNSHIFMRHNIHGNHHPHQGNHHLNQGNLPPHQGNYPKHHPN
jgi:ribosomal protein S18 acetylase RimI-like enzyme